MKKILLTGGAGFIGTNLAEMANFRGYEIIALDNFIKEGSMENIPFLESLPNVEIVKKDVCEYFTNDFEVDFIVHLAANVNASKALEDPIYDFSNNALTTLNILEYSRHHNNVPVIYASTCKVYTTEINNLPIKESEKRYEFIDRKGIDESFRIDAKGKYSRAPYGCSKYVGDLYMQEYHHLFGIPTVVNRLSTVYGPHQHGSEGYGWIDWFIRAKHQNLPITIFGNGKQVRDVLYVTDLCELIVRQIENIDRHQGEIYNVGGGPNNSVSLLEMIDLLNSLGGNRLSVKFAEWRQADFRIYVSDISKVSKKANWNPKISISEGVKKLWKTF